MFDGVTRAQDIDVCKAATNDLYTDRQALRTQSRWHRSSGQAGLVAP
jgi:hypothetical protein